MRHVTLAVLLLLLVGLTAGVAHANGTEVTLPDGERATITSAPDGVTVTLSNGKSMTITRSMILADADMTQAEMDKAQQAYDLATASQQFKSSQSKPILPGLLISGFGLFGLLNPRAVWFIKDGWKFRDAQPSDFALGIIRFGGAVMSLFGLGLMLFG